MTKRAVVVAGTLTGIVSAVVLVSLAVGYRHDITRSLERATLPKAVPYHAVSALPAPPQAGPAVSTTVATPATTPAQAVEGTASGKTTGLPAEINLAVPFTSQAPYGTWDAPYKEFCEEASVFMAINYIRSQPIASADAAAAGMQAIQSFEMKKFGYYQDTTASEVALIITEYFKYNKVKVLPNPTVQDIKQALAQAKLVIMPAAGRQLGNPFFTAPGPLYHMLVIKGYTTKHQFITNDPGTRRGADFLYNEDVLMNALHDWRSDGKIEQGRKVVLIVG